MSPSFSTRLTRELRATLSLALPLILAQLTQMLLMFSDTVMTGRLGSGQLAAISVSSNIIFFLAVGMWMTMASVNPIVAHHLGAGEHAEIRRLFPQVLWLGAFTALPVLLAVGLALVFLLPRLPLGVAEQGYARSYIMVYSLSMLPLMGYFALRYFLEGLGRTRANFAVTALSLPFDVFLNYVLIFGKFGFPQWGVAGAAASTAFSNLLIFCGLLWHLRRDPELRRYTRGHGWVLPDWGQLRGILKIGLPMGFAVFAEVSAFTGLGLAMSWFGSTSVAAHQIVMNVVSTTFMVPLGLSAAISQRCGQFLGARDPHGARFAAWTGIGLGAGFMALGALVLLTFRQQIVGIYTTDTQVLELAATYLFYGVLFQIFDGLQVTTMGALRGMKDTTVPMWICTLCYWGGGVVPALVMAFGLGWGPIGIWGALPPCLFLASISLVTRYFILSRRSARASIPAAELVTDPEEEEACLAR
jgi:MATE family multidrug resistance protein